MCICMCIPLSSCFQRFSHVFPANPHRTFWKLSTTVRSPEGARWFPSLFPYHRLLLPPSPWPGPLYSLAQPIANTA